METQNVGWKRQWDDKFLRQVCGFANSEGGVMKIGIDDDGKIIGVKDPKSDMKTITDTIANKLSIYPTVDVDETTNVITINVQKSSVPIDLDGKFYVRTGNTTHAASGRNTIRWFPGDSISPGQICRWTVWICPASMEMQSTTSARRRRSKR